MKMRCCQSSPVGPVGVHDEDAASVGVGRIRYERDDARVAERRFARRAAVTTSGRCDCEREHARAARYPDARQRMPVHGFDPVDNGGVTRWRCDGRMYAPLHYPASASIVASATAGSPSVNTLPPPLRSSYDNVPPCAMARRSAIDSPSPALPASGVLRSGR